jgi:hypothetical protein
MVDRSYRSQKVMRIRKPQRQQTPTDSRKITAGQEDVARNSNMYAAVEAEARRWTPEKNRARFGLLIKGMDGGRASETKAATQALL